MRDEYQVIKRAVDGAVSCYGTLLNREWAERVARYAQADLPAGGTVEIQLRVVPPPPPPWETVAVYEPLWEPTR